MPTSFCRANPSPRYLELLAQYRLMHTEGERHQQIPPEKTFAGQSLPRHSSAIKTLIDECHARSILDYGSGKGAQYQPLAVRLDDGRLYPSIVAYWGVDTVTCYDPGYEPFSRLPTVRFDGVVCTDVLEHCPEDDLPWILDELFLFAKKFVFANVACYPARKRLASGENAHCTIKHAAWWQSLLNQVSARYPSVRYQFTFDEVRTTSDGGRALLTASAAR